MKPLRGKVSWEKKMHVYNFALLMFKMKQNFPTALVNSFLCFECIACVLFGFNTF